MVANGVRGGEWWLEVAETTKKTATIGLKIGSAAIAWGRKEEEEEEDFVFCLLA